MCDPIATDIVATNNVRNNTSNKERTLFTKERTHSRANHAHASPVAAVPAVVLVALHDLAGCGRRLDLFALLLGHLQLLLEPLLLLADVAAFFLATFSGVAVTCSIARDERLHE